MKETVYERKLKTRWKVYQNELNMQTKKLKINWEELEKTNKILYFDDIPWEFENILNKEIRKKLLLRFHPDLFFNSNIGKRVHSDDRERVLNQLITITQRLISWSSPETEL